MKMKDLDTSNFTGTTRYYRFSPITKAVLTDGTNYIATETENFGLMQDIALDLVGKQKVKHAMQNGFVVIDIDTESFGLKYSDGNNNALGGYPLIGYPELKIRLFAGWADEGVPVIFLPSEY